MIEYDLSIGFCAKYITFFSAKFIVIFGKWFNRKSTVKYMTLSAFFLLNVPNENRRKSVRQKL